MKPPVILIANLTARHASEQSIERAKGLLSSAGYEVTLYLTQKRGDAKELAQRESGRASLIIAAGGDGTINEVVNGVAYTNTPLAILPMGTTNVLAKELGIPEDVDGALNAALTGSVHNVSLGKITLEHTVPLLSRYFCLMAGIGYDGEAVYGFDSSVKRHSGKGAYVLSGLKVLLRYNPNLLTFAVDGETYAGYSAIIGNASKYGGNFRVTPDADILMPHLYLFIMEGRKRSDLLRYLTGVLMGRHLGFRDIVYRRVSSVRVSGNAHIQIDGDYLGKTPATITVAPAALKIVY